MYSNLLEIDRPPERRSMIGMEVKIFFSSLNLEKITYVVVRKTG